MDSPRTALAVALAVALLAHAGRACAQGARAPAPTPAAPAPATHPTAAPPPVHAPAACTDPVKPGPVFKTLRYEERFCDRQARPGDPGWMRFKGLDAGDAVVSLGGELRVRAESVNPVRAGLRGGRDDSYTLYRGLVHADVRASDRFRVFAQLGYWDEAGRRGGPAGTDRDRGDVQQLFVELGDPKKAWLRAGRQETLLGSGRLIGIRAAPNIRLTFDGARVATTWRGTRFEVFHLRPVAIEPDGWNNEGNSRERVTGLYATRNDAIAGLNLDVYAFRFERASQRYQNGTGPERRNVFGVRLFGTKGAWTFNDEVTLQGGRTGERRVRAWSVQTDTAFKPRAQPKLTVGLKAGAASGDKDKADDRIDTFQPIYAAAPYYMQSSLIFPANLAGLQPYLEWRIHPKLSLLLEAQANWRVETTDGYYQPGPTAYTLDGEGRHLADQVGLSGRWTPRRDLSVEAWATHLKVAGPLERAGARDTDFFSVMATWSF